jgi:hypothetical protein
MSPHISIEMDCQHAGVCDESCECHCDTCTERFELNWNTYTVENNMCNMCGIPKEISLEVLDKTKYMHFYSPCANCLPAYTEFMSSKNVCTQCQAPLLDGKCAGCFCTEEDDCPCRQCVTARAKVKYSPLST